MIALSESVVTDCVQRLLADIAPWRQFQFARKHNLGNSAWWRWNLCWSVLGKCCHPFEIRHWELYTAPLAETSRRCLSGLQINTLLCRKRYMIDDNFLMNANMKSGSSYQIPSARTNNSTPLAAKRRWHHSYSVRKLHYLGNGACLR